MNEQSLKGILGLSVRAGQAAFGEDTCRRLLLSGKGGLLLLDGDASGNTRKRIGELCGRTETALAILPAGMICAATGRDNMVMALKKGAFAERAQAVLAPETK